MGIIPLDIRMMVPRTQQVSHVQQAENQKAPTDQFMFQQHMDKEVKRNSERVIHPKETEKEEKFDATQGNNDKERRNSKNRNSKRQTTNNDDAKDKDIGTINNKGHFDFKI